MALWSGARERSLLSDLAAGEPVSSSDANASDVRQAIVGGVQGVVFTLTAAAFLAWFYRAYRNLPALGATDLRYGRRWAIAAWFVPILNLWRPKQITNDIWRETPRTAPADQGGIWENEPVPRLFALWWAAWLVSQWLYNGSFRLVLRADDVPELRTANGVTMLADLSSALAGALCIVVVQRITAREEGRAVVVGVRPEELSAPLYRRRSAWATLVAVVVALGGQAALGAAVWTGALDPGGSEPPAGDPDLLAQDDFDDSGTGWPVQSGRDFSTGYDAQTYRIQIKRREYERHSYLELLEPVAGMQIEVEATLRQGSRADGYGLGCWVGDNAGYYAAVFADGFHAIVKDPTDTDEVQLVSEGTDRDAIIKRGIGTNDVRFDCVHARPGAVELALWVNGEQLLATRDEAALDSFTGLGMFVWSSSGRTDVKFDDLVARRATGASARA